MADIVVAASGRRRRHRQSAATPGTVEVWPPAWRALAGRWVRRDSPRGKWETLLAAAGGDGFETAHDVLEAMLDSGWIAVEEIWRAGRWQPLWVEFLHLAALRGALGVPAPGERRAAQEAARADLLAALERWTDDVARPAQATRRDFAQFARGDTKGITAAEWEWLETQRDLAAYGIGDHTPLLCVAAPLTLHGPRGQLDLNAIPDFLGLSPAALETAIHAESSVQHWMLAENRTSFERLARMRGQGVGVIWLPGFPPCWWQTAVARLLCLAPARARIACDPDPAGIEIALAAGKVWEAAGLIWEPWLMEAATLAAMRCRKPLTERDRARLAALSEVSLPAALRGLADKLAQSGEKGEQEAYL